MDKYIYPNGVAKGRSLEPRIQSPISSAWHEAKRHARRGLTNAGKSWPVAAIYFKRTNQRVHGPSRRSLPELATKYVTEVENVMNKKIRPVCG